MKREINKNSEGEKANLMNPAGKHSVKCVRISRVAVLVY